MCVYQQDVMEVTVLDQVGAQSVPLCKYPISKRFLQILIKRTGKSKQGNHQRWHCKNLV
jgi:hypothetical protein